jgi:hypothetical protein
LFSSVLSECGQEQFVEDLVLLLLVIAVCFLEVGFVPGRHVASQVQKSAALKKMCFSHVENWSKGKMLNQVEKW